ncbi:MAG: UDP-N-acetylglucosamine 1-carboxyvinyltransferase [Candidatus Peribacteraceae bacterium]
MPHNTPVNESMKKAQSPSVSQDQASIQYRIRGQKPLHGTVRVSGSKNAALPILAATVLSKGKTTLTNVPRLSDTRKMCEILEYLGAVITKDETTVTVDATLMKNVAIPHDMVSRMRGSIVLLGPLLARFGEVKMGYPGGCVLGKRSVDSHMLGFAQMGIVDKSTDNELHLVGFPKSGTVILPEFSVTATENILLAAALSKGVTTIELAAAEPHVQDTAKFLVNRGIRIDGIGSHTLIVHGQSQLLPEGEHSVVSDYLEAGAFILAALATKGNVRIEGADKSHLTSFLGAVSRVSGKVTCEKNGDIVVDGASSNLVGTRIQTNIFPGFPTDLQSPFGVLLTQAKGVSRIFEVLFEGRMAYLYELEKMGAHIEVLNSHQALIIGPTSLRGRQVASNDIRAGVGMVIAGLAAEGETVITDVHYIERGYDRLEEKLTALGADIVREEV